MPGTRAIVFLTDFGLDSEWVGICHAVIARVAPDARVIDLSHFVEPLGVEAGARLLSDSMRYLPDDAIVDGPVWIGSGVSIGTGVRLTGPIVLGDNATVGDRAQLRSSIVFPGTEIAADSILIGAISAHNGIVQSLRRRG